MSESTREMYCYLRNILTVSEKFVYIFLRDEQRNYKSPVEHTAQAIGYILGITEKTVRTALTNLEKQGLIRFRTRKGKRVIEVTSDEVWSTDDEVARCLASFLGEVVQSPPEEEETYASPDTVHIIEHWNSKESLKKIKFAKAVFPHLNYPMYITDKVGKLTAHSVNELVEGKFFNNIRAFRFYHDQKWSPELICKIIDHLVESIENPDCYPINKKTYKALTLISFLYNPYKGREKSVFLSLLNGPRFVGFKTEEIRRPGLFRSLREAYERDILKGSPMSPLTERKLINVSNTYGDLADKWMAKGYCSKNIFSSMWADHLIDFFIENKNWLTDPLRYLLRGAEAWEKVINFFHRKRILIDYPKKI